MPFEISNHNIPSILLLYSFVLSREYLEFDTWFSSTSPSHCFDSLTTSSIELAMLSEDKVHCLRSINLVQLIVL